MFQPCRYEVTGIQPVLDHEPGSFFEADLDPAQEMRLLRSGALRLVPVDAPVYPPPLDSEPPARQLPPPSPKHVVIDWVGRSRERLTTPTATPEE